MMQTALAEVISSFPRVRLVTPTPLYRLERLEKALGSALGGSQLYIKRDDHMLLGGGGNKLRKLEFLLAEAKTNGADTVITVGGLQSNHARLTAAAAAKAGLSCELILSRDVSRDDADYEENGNILLDGIFGARLEMLEKGQNALERAHARAEELRSSGSIVTVIPTGGSTPVGALGYCTCALEIQQSATELDIEFSKVIIPNGSSGTHAGLAAGFSVMGKSASVVRSYSVMAEPQVALGRTLALTNDVLELLKHKSVSVKELDINGEHRGQGYGIPTEGMLEAVRLLARTEGLLLDPVYSGKAFAGMLSDFRNGAFEPNQNVLFVMTGGIPGLYAYKKAFQS
jgi:D-cysteine desulfhydrase